MPCQKEGDGLGGGALKVLELRKNHLSERSLVRWEAALRRRPTAGCLTYLGLEENGFEGFLPAGDMNDDCSTTGAFPYNP